MANEERNFLQYFMPYKNIGYVKNATVDAMVNLERIDDSVNVQVYVTSVQHRALIRLTLAGEIIFEEKMDLDPAKTFGKTVQLTKNVEETQLKISVFNERGNLLISYSPVLQKDKAIPDPAKAIGDPKNISTNEALYLAGLHLEQYRHAT
jgi:hypothetical protein